MDIVNQIRLAQLAQCHNENNMSSISFITMQQEVAALLKMDLGDAAQLALIKRWINFAQDDVNSRSCWPWLESREIVQTVIEKTDGTVSISSGGTAVTGVSTAFASTDVGSFIQFSSTDDWYKILTVPDTLSLTIEKPYTDTSALSAGTYIIRKVYYSLSSSVEKVLNLRQSITPIKLATYHWRTFDMYKPDITSTGSPDTCVMFGMDSSKNWQFFLHPIPDAVMNLEFRTKIKSTDLSADDDSSIIPEKWVKSVVLSGAIWRGMEYGRVGKEDIRADKWYAIYEAGIARMMADDTVTEDIHNRLQTNESSSGGVMSARFPDNYDTSN